MRYIERYQADAEEQKFEDRRTIAGLKEKIEKYRQVSLNRNMEQLITANTEPVEDPDSPLKAEQIDLVKSQQLTAFENLERMQETPLLLATEDRQQVEQESPSAFERRSMKSTTLNLISNVNAQYEQTILDLTTTVFDYFLQWKINIGNNRFKV